MNESIVSLLDELRGQFLDDAALLALISGRVEGVNRSYLDGVQQRMLSAAARLEALSDDMAVL